MSMLQLAYVVNIVVLLPIVMATIFRIFPADEGRFDESEGWRLLVGGLWTGIVVLSVLGLFQPVLYSPVLLLQVIYKSIWLVAYVAPRLARRETSAVPWKMASCFVAIVAVWPFVLPWAYLLGSGG